MNRRSSLRLIECPIPPISGDVLASILYSSRSLSLGCGCAHFLSRILHGFHDVLVASAATEVPRNSPANVFLGRMRFFLKKATSRHDHARRAEPALEAVLFFESLLQRMQRAGVTNALDRSQFAAIGLNRKQRARFYGSTI